MSEEGELGLVKTGTLADRIANRIVRHFPGPRINVETARPIVSFTFDDAPETAFSRGAARLESVGARGTYYIAGGVLERKRADGPFLSAEACGELAERGHELACHTFSHRKLAQYGRRALAEDLERSAAFLTECDGRTGARNFAVPYIMSWPPAQGELRRRFLTSRGGMPGINRGTVDPFNLVAHELRDGGPEAGALAPVLDDLCASPGWLIFFTHDVAASEFGCTEDRLAALIDAVLARGCTIATVDGAIDLLGLRARLGRDHEARPA